MLDIKLRRVGASRRKSLSGVPCILLGVSDAIDTGRAGKGGSSWKEVGCAGSTWLDGSVMSVAPLDRADAISADTVRLRVR